MDNIQEIVSAKAEELFNLCDKDQKGYIIKSDIQCLQDEFDLNSEQLENVFHLLDVDHNGFLSFEEFTSGFGVFLNNQMLTNQENEHELIEHNPNDEEEQRTFHHTLERLGAKDLYDDEETIMNLWLKLRETDPILLRQFEQFIGKVTDEITRSKSDHRSIEAALHNRSSVHNDEIRKLYDEMEHQIKLEKAKILEQEKLKEREFREQMEQELYLKEQELNEMIKKYSDLERKLTHINLNELEAKNENERLQKEKLMLEQEFQMISSKLEESQNYISQLQIQTKKEKQERAKQALNFTENIAIERENLVKELDSLKSLNKRLLDEHDLYHGANFRPRNSSPARPLRREGSVLADYFTRSPRSESEPEEEGLVIFAVDHNELFNQNHSKNSQLGTRQQPVGANVVFQHSELMNVAPNAIPDRMYKVAFIGDSGVGKTSFIQRFCKDTFKESFSATVGIDLQVKMLNIDSRIIALQLWDTAGQERFRSITKQYFRKSDGIILIYDVTSEITFQNVRSWITSVQELAEDNCILALIGNKIDLCRDDEHRPIKYKDGAKLADEYGCLFFECSARLGTSVIEIMEGLTRLMQDKDDRLRTGVPIIDPSLKAKKNTCCGL